MKKMYSAHVTRTKANLKEDLFNGLEFRDWKNQVKIDSPVFVKPDFTFPYYKKKSYYWLGTTKGYIGD